MTPEHVKNALFVATRTEYKDDVMHEFVDFSVFAKMIQFRVMDEMLAVAKANMILSDSAEELFKDLQAYDRYERGFNF